MDNNALPNILTIGPPESPILTLYNQAQNGNGDAIESVSGVFGVDVIGDALSIDEIDAVVHYGGPLDAGMNVWEVYLGPGDEVYLDPDGESVYAQLLASAPDGSRGTPVDLRALPFGTPVRWTNNGRLIAAFYLQSVGRVGRYLWKITACSGVGLLDKVDHVGGIYTGQTVSAVLSEIIGSAFPYTVADSLASQQVYGWLPYDTARNNLHQLLFALGAAMRRDANGEAQFVFLSAAAPQAVDDSRVSFGGSVFYDTPATRAEITEHAFFVTAGDETVTLFNNTEAGQLPASNTPVRFDGPMHDLTVTGTLTYSESGVNYAIVSGTGTLTGKAYTHTMRIVAQDAAGATGEPNVKHVDDYTLISLANSLNVAKRVLAYYQAARTVSASLTLDGERCGDVLSLDDPYFDPITAFLESVSVNASTTLWGPAKLVENYTPTNQGNNVTGRDVLRGSGTWISQVSGTIQYVLISGAQGGCAGNDASVDSSHPSLNRTTETNEYGQTVTKYNYGATTPGRPGIGGNPGNGGRIISGTLTVIYGQQINFATGTGGAGEVYGSGVGHGENGTDTVFGALSTANGQVLENGFFDPITGNQFGQKGDYGNPGALPGYEVEFNGTVYTTGSNAPSFSASGRFGGSNLTPGHGSWRAEFSVVEGGAPAYGGNGGPASSTTFEYQSGNPVIMLGAGGRGGDALPPNKELIPGKGGKGGNGGGARGFFPWGETTAAGGSVTVIRPDFDEEGRGSDGGQGADGCILLYWGG